MRTRLVTATVVGLVAFGCTSGDAERPTATDAAVTASAGSARAGCASESDLGMDSGGSYPFFASVEELVLAADVVVVGTVADVTCHDADGAMQDRHAVIEVEDTLHGDQVQQVEIVSPGDEQGGPITVDGVPPPMPGETAIWFLGESEARPGTFDPVGPQGRYLVGGENLVPVTRDADARVHQVAQQIAGMGRSGLTEAIAAASQAIATGELTDQWANPSGADVVTSVRMGRGPLHCGWQDMWFLHAEVGALPEDDPRRLRTYVANPTSGYGVDGWDPDTDLPHGAVDTGWRRGTTELWLATADGRGAAYLVDGATVERLPLDDTGQGCE